MPEGQEQQKPNIEPIRKSKSPRIQKFVEQKKAQITSNYPERFNEYELNQMARDRVADILRTRKQEQEKNHKDHLTGIYNRAGFYENVQRELGKMEKDIKNGIQRKAVVFFLDADELKIINDTQGHEEGDKHLKTIAEIISTSSRTGNDQRTRDICARLGGDEFVIFVSDAGIDDIFPFWNKLNSCFNEKNIKISAGVSEVNIDEPEISVQHADKAMYHAKQIGKKTGENTMIKYNQLKTAE